LIAAKGRDRRCRTARLLVLHLHGIVADSHARVFISIHAVVFSTIRSVLKTADHRHPEGVRTHSSSGMAHSNWEADKMLDVYIYDYLLKRNLHTSAKAFMQEGKVSADPVAIDAPGGFLFEWWSVFWDIFIARTNEKHSEVAASYIETQQMKAREQQHQQLHLQQIQLLQQRHAQQQQRRDVNHGSLNGVANGINSENMLGQSTANAMATKIYEERLKHPHQRDGDSPAHLLDANRTALLKAASNPSGVLLQSTAALQQVQARSQQMGVNTQEIKNDVNVVLNQRSPITDPSIFGVPGAVQPKSNLLNPGMNQGVGALPLKGWPLAVDQLRPSLVQQGQKSFMQSPQQLHQFHLLSTQQQQQILMQTQQQTQGNLTSSGSPVHGEMDPRRFRALLRGGMTGKEGHPAGNDSSQHAGSPMQAASPMARAPSQEQADILMKMAQMQQQPLAQQQQQQQQQQQDQQQQQLQQTGTQNQQQDRMTGVVCVPSDSNNAMSFQTGDQVQSGRKRKQPSSSGPANSTGTGNTAAPSLNSAPSTPSTHTPGDVMSIAGTLHHSSSMSKNLMMYGSDGTGGLASPSNQLADLEHFGEVGSLDENVESFLSQDDGDIRDGLFGTIKPSPTEHNMDVSNGFSFSEFTCLRASTSKVVCCHFSSDGKLLASAGHDKKAVLWNMDTLKLKSTLDEHSHLITDVRFSPNSTSLATSSFDMSVKVWDAENPTYAFRTFTGHLTSVMSLDFHSNNGADLLCSCDSNSEIRYWSVGQGVCTRVSKGGMAQVRFQPCGGKFLAAAAENVVSIFDVETDACIHSLQRHTKPVHSVCWDATGDFLASVSEDSVRVWSLASRGECVYELSCNGNKFHSCVFHPKYSSLLVIGCYQSLELWNMAENKSMTLTAHEGLIAGLAQSPATGMVASASHDKCVKLWK